MQRLGYLFLLFSILFITGCDDFDKTVKESQWFRQQQKYASDYNARHQSVIAVTERSQEIWLGQVAEVESFRIILEHRKCLYSEHKDFFGNYCNKPDKLSFYLETRFLKNPLQKGDIIAFVSTHSVVKSFSGMGYPHKIDGTRMVKLEVVSEVAELRALEFDSVKEQVFQKSIQDFAALASCTERNYDLEKLETLLKNGTNPNAMDDSYENGYSFFHWYLSRERATAEATKLLIDYGADVNLLSIDGATPLSIAALNVKSPLELCKVLLDAGANPNLYKKHERDFFKYPSNELLPPLFSAVKRNNFKLVALLLKYNADPYLGIPLPKPNGVMPYDQIKEILQPVDLAKDYRMLELIDPKKRLIKNANIAKLMKEEVIRVARDAIAGKMNYDERGKIVVEHTDTEYIVTFPLPPFPPGTVHGDYAAKVFIYRQSLQVKSILGSP